MSQSASAPDNPLKFEPDMEHFEENEADTEIGLEDALKSIRETTFEHSGHAMRSVHAKSHGVLFGSLAVPENLPGVLAQGLFSKGGNYRVVMRLSTVPGDILNDSVSTPRGVAIKVIGVDGARLPGSEADVTQDFLMVNAPAFSAPTAAKFLGNLKTLAGTTDKYEAVKEVLSRVARGTEAILEAFGGKSSTVVTMGGHAATHILGETFYSQTPFLFGRYICKFALVPSSPGLRALTRQSVDVNARPDALREAVIEHFGRDGGEWELQVQLNTDLQTMPIEDASVPWPEDKSPYVTVARISAPAQDAWSAENVAAVDDGASFAPWHGLAAHRPLGGVNRARKDAYANAAEFRGSHNGCPIKEPPGGEFG
ncbi:catalase family protein [Rhodopila sp.]|uniref:catalase family protein n=1 Tax=Rhodopila sp. TaxID=2480087 RepID=UPI003D0EE4D5